MMQKIILVFITLLSVSLADTFDVLKYHIDLSLLGKVGDVEIIVDTKDDEYEIRMNARTSGKIARLTARQDLTYISRGKIVDGRFITDTFEKHTEFKEEKQL